MNNIFILEFFKLNREKHFFPQLTIKSEREKVLDCNLLRSARELPLFSQSLVKFKELPETLLNEMKAV